MQHHVLVQLVSGKMLFKAKLRGYYLLPDQISTKFQITIISPPFHSGELK